MSRVDSCDVNIGGDLNEDAESSCVSYNPKVGDEFVPWLGQQFDTVDEGASFYNAYSKQAGFSIRSSTTRTCKKTGKLLRKEFVCFKVGDPVELVGNESKRRRGSIGENCKAKMALLHKFGAYVVTVFNEGHSHPLSSDYESHLLRSHRNVSDVAKCLRKQMDIVNIPKSQQYGLLEVQSGGIENVGFLKKDFYNHDRDVRSLLKGHDGERFYDYMRLEELKNPAFTFKIEADDENKITRCFWCDAISKRSYNFFGDVVIFDTTYQTNRYGLIFAPLMGVNNHGQTIIFGCAFLNHETVEDFVWLFTNFLESMPGGHPEMIITDQDPAMAKALPLVMPGTVHRFCIWHILVKFAEKLDCNKYAPYAKEFSKCIWDSESPEEFDIEWKRVVEISKLEDNSWLKDLFDIRAKWIPAYVNHVFSANMSSSQRAESGHAFFKRFVSNNNSLVDFMIRFDRGLANRRHEELIADHKDKIEKPKLRIPHPLLAQMADIYTREMYYKFEEQLFISFEYRLRVGREDDNHRVYEIQNMKNDKNKIREIIVDKVLEYVSCSCKMFESGGILCRHILAYFNKFADFERIPDKYILKRWSKSAKLGIVEDSGGVVIVDDSSLLLMRSKMMQSCIDLVDKAICFTETREMFEDSLRNINVKVDEFMSSHKIGETSNIATCDANSFQASCTFPSNYKEPDMARPKGCGKRLKGGKEIALKKLKNQRDRRCHGCNQVGQSHDKRNCPAFLNAASKVHMNEEIVGDLS